jgi:SP family sugar porter-like MFS transporter
MLDRAVGPSGSFLTYGGICVAGALLVYLAVPETRGRSLEQMDEVA